MVVVGYARVSTAEQSQNSYALEQQVARLVAAGAEEIIQDVESGSSKKRVGYRQLCDRIPSGEISEIVATRFDRLGRSLIELRRFIDLCMTNGVNLRLLDQPVDLSTSHGKLQANMIGSVAEWERDMLIERVNAGLRHFRQERRAPGVVPFGYCRVSDRYQPNREQYRDTEKTCWEVAREVVETFLEIRTVRGTAREMGTRYPRQQGTGGAEFDDFPRENGLKYWLQNPVLRGHIGYFYRTRKTPDIIPDQHEALITVAEGTEIDLILSKERRGTRTFTPPMPLAGIVYCAVCGRKGRLLRVYKENRATKGYWYCSGQYSAPPTCQKSAGITNETLEAAAIAALTERGESIARLAHQARIGAPSGDTPEIEEAIATIKALENLPPSEEIREAIRKLENKVEALRSQAKGDRAIQDGLESELVVVCSDPGFWEQLPQSSKRRLFQRFISRVDIRDGAIAGVSLRV